MALANLFNDIADAIREKDGTTSKIVANTFPARILAIPDSGVQVESIEITVPPRKPTYTVGETFDPTGMAVYADFDNAQTFYVNHSNLTFSPSGPLEEGTTAVTVSYSWGGKTVSTQQPVTVSVSTRHVWGAEWDGTASSKWTRTDDAALFTDPVPYVAGATEYGSPFDGLMPWSGMVKEERIGGTMVAIPKYWYKLESVGSNKKGLKIQISNEEGDGFHVSPAHMDRGDENGERDVVYIGRYHCGPDFKSNSGQMPKAKLTRSNFRSSIHSIGADVWQASWDMWFTIQCLYLVEFSDWNSQKTIGAGGGDGIAPQITGYTDSMPYHTGTTQSNRDTHGLGTQYRNIEGLWDNVYDYMDGCYNASNGLNIILNPNNFSDGNGGTSVGTPKSGWPSAFNVVNQAGFPMIIPSETNGGDNVASCDYWNFDASRQAIYVGCNYHKLSNCGLFYVGNATTSSVYAYIGSRIMELPTSS